MNEVMYKVKEVEGKPGLTVGSRVIQPGGVFSEDQWPYGKKAIEAAMENGRCELMEQEKPAKKAEPAKKPEPAKENKAGGKPAKKTDSEKDEN